MTDDENRKLAEWMGWHENKKVNWWCDINDKGIFGSQQPFYFGCEFCELWHPRNSIEQAMMLLDKVLSWTLRKDKVGYNQADVNIGGKVFESEWELSPAAAIVEAVLRAIEEP